MHFCSLLPHDGTLSLVFFYAKIGSLSFSLFNRLTFRSVRSAIKLQLRMETRNSMPRLKTLFEEKMCHWFLLDFQSFCLYSRFESVKIVRVDKFLFATFWFILARNEFLNTNSSVYQKYRPKFSQQY